MNRTKLIALLRLSAMSPGESTRFCLDDETIAGFVDNALDDAARRGVLQHLYDCPACVRRTGRLARLLRDDKASRPLASPRNSEWRATALPWAAAAAVLIALGWLSMTSPDPEPALRDVRNAESSVAAPEILAPSSGIVASNGTTLIRWTRVPGATDYAVVIVTDVGDVVVSTRVEEPRLRIDNTFGLEPGRDYYVRVSAHLSDEQSIRSEHIPLRLIEP